MEWLKSQNIAFTEKDVRADEQAMAELAKLGSQSTPTLVVDGEVMVGFRPDQLLEMLK